MRIAKIFLVLIVCLVVLSSSVNTGKNNNNITIKMNLFVGVFEAILIKFIVWEFVIIAKIGNIDKKVPLKAVNLNI